MNDNVTFDLLLRDVLASGPDRANGERVDAAISTAAAQTQRTPRLRWLDGRAWPPARGSVADPALRRSLRLVLIAVIAIGATVATLAAGARLFDRFQPPPPRPLSMVTVGELPDGIGSPAVVALPDGRLVVGSQGTGTALAGIFSPQDGTSIVIPTSQATAISFAGLRPDGRVVLYGVIFGAGDGPGTAAVWTLDPRTATLEQAPAPVAVPLEANAALLADGRLLFVDRVTGSVVIIDPTTGVQAKLPALVEAANMGYDFMLTPLRDGRVLLVDGFGIASGPNASVHVYDPRTGTQLPVGRIHQDRFEGAARPVELADGRWLIIGGEQDGRNGVNPVAAYLFDPRSGGLLAIADLPHSVTSATALPDGRVVLIGNWVEFPPDGVPADRVEDDWLGLYDPTTEATIESRNPVTLDGALPVDLSRPVFASVLMPDGSVALLGVTDGQTAAIDVFSPGTKEALP